MKLRDKNKINDFQVLLSECNTNANYHGLFHDDTTRSYLTLSQVSVMSVLKKLSDPRMTYVGDRDKIDNSGCNRQIDIMKSRLLHDVDILKNMSDIIDNAYVITYDNDGNIKRSFNEEMLSFISDTLSDGVELVHECYIALIEESRKQLEQGNKVNLTSDIIVRHLSKKVYINDDDKKVFEDKDSKPIIESFKAVRRYVSNNRSMQIDPRSQYIYLEELAIDEESDTVEKVYKRLAKHYQLVDTMEIHGNSKTVTMTSVSQDTVDTVENIIESLNLTKKQRQVLDYKLRGYGCKAIARKLKVSPQAIKKTYKAIIDKSINIGFMPDNIFHEYWSCEIGEEFCYQMETRQDTPIENMTDEYIKGMTGKIISYIYDNICVHDSIIDNHNSIKDKYKSIVKVVVDNIK